MALGSRSLPAIFQTVFHSNVNTLNAVVEPECQVTTLADGTVVQINPELCAKRSIEKSIASKDNFVNNIIVPVVQAVAGFVPVIGTASSIAIKAGNAIQEAGRGAPSFEPRTGFVGTTGGRNMGLFDDIWGGVQNAASGIFSGSQSTIDWNGLLQGGVGLATQALAPRGALAPAQATFAPATMAAAPVIARAGAVVGRTFFNRFPSLATAIQTLRNSGMNVTRAKLYGVMKRFGPEFLVTGGLLTAAAVNELAVAGPGYRRMNPANVRALRRSVRRIESFHRLCKTTDTLRRRKR